MNNISMPIEEIIKKIVKEKIEEEIETLIDAKTQNFHDILVNRKDEYISQIMKGIRIMHEQEPMTMTMNYKIIFENIVKIKGESNE